jgi:transporter family-2 protein
MTALQSNSGFYAVLMLFAGIGIPIMATLNSGLGVKLQSPALAVSIFDASVLAGEVKTREL